MTPLSKISTAPGEGTYDYSALMAPLPADISKKIQQWGRTHITEEQLCGNGREDYSHVTVKYGIHSPSAGEIRPLLEEQPAVKIYLGKVSLFKNDECDVVKIDVSSSDLHKLHTLLSEEIENTETFPTYIPHITIAFVKPGSADHLVGDTSFEGVELTVNTLDFSGKNGHTAQIQLQAQSKTSANHLLLDPRLIKFFKGRGISEKDYRTYVSTIKVKPASDIGITLAPGEAQYDPNTHTIIVSDDLLSSEKLSTTDLTTIVHELEHDIQNELLSPVEYGKGVSYFTQSPEYSAFLQEISFLLHQKIPEKDIIQHLLEIPGVELTRKQAQELIDTAKKVSPQFISAEQHLPSNCVYQMAMLCSLATGLPFLTAAQKLFEDPDKFLTQVNTIRSEYPNSNHNLEITSSSIEELGGWEPFCSVVKAKIAQINSKPLTASTYTSEEMEEFYTDQHDYESDSGGGNVYYDWNHDSTDYPKPRDIESPPVRLDQLVPPERRFKRWIVPPRGDQTDFFTAPVDSGDIEASSRYTITAEDPLQLVEVKVETANLDLSKLEGYAALLGKKFNWNATLVSREHGVRLYRIDMSSIEEAINNLKLPAKNKRTQIDRVRQLIQKTLHSDISFTERTVPSHADINRLFDKLPKIWWSNQGQTTLNLSTVRDLLLRQNFDSGYFDTFKVGNTGTYSWTTTDDKLLVTKMQKR